VNRVSNENIIVLCGVFILMFVLSLTGVEGAGVRIIFLAAALATALVSVNSGWVNSIFMALIFNFTYYSFHPGDRLGNLFINLAVFSALALLAAKIHVREAEKAASKEEGDEKVFLNKIINSFMLAHGMVTEIKRGISRAELMALYARNVSHLTGTEHTLYYSGEGAAEGGFNLVFSSGKYQEKSIQNQPLIGSFAGKLKKSLGAEEAGFISGAKGNAIVIPTESPAQISGAMVLYKGSEFSYSDIYVIEFFSAQVFIIMEKQDLLKKMSENYEHIIEALAIAIDTKDHATHGHSMATMKYAVKKAEKMDLPEEDRQMIRYAALLHDIGKINISSSILNKPDKLTAEEFELIKKHPEDGVGILEKLDIFGELLPVIMHHHEHFDGKGYPKKLSGRDIPLGSRICSIADAYSVMIADRPYRRARTKSEAFDELKRCSGTQFDREIVDVFLGILHEDEDGGAVEHGRVN